jgi:hypothetical protein
MSSYSERPPIQLSLFPTIPVGEPGPPCLACGGPTIISYPDTRGQHHARVDCTRCRAWRWAPKPRPMRRKD